MHFSTALLATLSVSFVAAAKTYIGQFTAKGDSTALHACVESLIANPSWNGAGWPCGNHKFQLGGNGHWASAADCVGRGCSSFLLGAADQGADWAKCGQESGVAKCWVGWSPKDKHMCGNDAPCSD